MGDTQVLDFQLDSVPEEPQNADDLEIGSLEVNHADGKRETHLLYTGQNFVARRSAQRHRDDEKVQAWKREHPGAALHGVFLESASVSSPHAIIYMEARGNFCFVKDLGSKNKTVMEGPSGSIVLQTGDRYAVYSGAVVKFGNIGCTIQYSAQPMGTPLPAEAPHQAAPPGLEATQAYNAVEAERAEGALQDLGGQLQSPQAAAEALEAAPAAAPVQVRSLPPHLHAAKRPPTGPPLRAPNPRLRPPVATPNAWPTAQLHLPSLLNLPGQAKPEQQENADPRPAAGATPMPRAEQPQASQAQPATAWASFQQSAAASMQRAHSLASGSELRMLPALETQSSSRRSLDSLSPFASVSQEGPKWIEAGDLPAASATMPIPLSVRGSMERDSSSSSLKNISSIASLRDWGASKGVPRRGSTERLPSLQDWMLPLCISSPPKSDGITRTCSQDLLCSEAMPRAEQFVQWACSASARPSAPSANPKPYSHDILERMPNALQEALPLTGRSNSVPKRSRDAELPKDDSPTAHAAAQQRPKSPRLARAPPSSSFTLGLAPRCARSGSPHPGRHDASAAGFSSYPGTLDSLWGAGSDGACHVRLPNPTTAR